MSIGKYAPPIAALCVLLWASRGGAAERGLAAYYPLDEGTGGVARDRSGHDHHGTIHGNAKWARASWGTALVFDGQGVYVDCGADKGLDISGGGTVSVWCRPERLQGGIVNWSTGGAWADERLVLAINTYHGDASLMGCLADGRGFQRLGGFGEIEVGQWTHLAITFDGDTVRLYRDGLIVDRRSQGLTPALAGVPLWIGRCLGLGRQWFHGLIDEVRIYDRPLSAREMLVLYKRQAVDRGKDTAIFRRPAVAARPYPDPGKVLIELDVRAMQPLPAGARLRVAVRRADDATPVAPAATSAVPAGGKATIAFDLAKVSPGTYRLNASVRRPDGSLVGEESSASFVWPGQTEGYRG
ncbi:MAG TPA: LamG domain-containing protein, partial [Planctomycetaceae bacterium]|nr:LamG domain-containing protein [Planctomycetaceae bacterium]